MFMYWISNKKLFHLLISLVEFLFIEHKWVSSFENFQPGDVKLQYMYLSIAEPSEYIIFASDSGIHSLSLSGALAAPLPSLLNNGTQTMDIDHRRNKIYYTQSSPNAIMSAEWTDNSNHHITNISPGT